MSAGDNSLQSTLTDMMASLMVIFILLLVNYLKNAQDAEAKAAAAPKKARESIMDELQARLSGEQFKGVVVKEDINDPYQLIIVIPVDLLFSTGVSELSPKAHTFLDGFTPRFGDVICSNEFSNKIQSFVIEGYTDTDPVRGEAFGNMRLSQNRSFAVLTRLLEVSGEKYPCFRSLSSASGRGEEGCVASATEQEKANCRRVDFKIRVKSEKALELQESMAAPEVKVYSEQR